MALQLTTLMIIMSLFSLSALAADRQTTYDANYCFSQADFLTEETQSMSGIFVTQVPSATVSALRMGDRTIQAGDVLPVSALDSLILEPVCTSDRNATITYLPISDNTIGGSQSLEVSIFSGKDECPVAMAGEIETYKNVPNSGTLMATDPENQELKFDLVTSPKRGSVDMTSDGTYTYTPAKNKVGSDSFSFVVTDKAGNSSESATVKVEILKPIDKLTYSDMTDDADQFPALWLHSSGLFTGESVGNVACFNPEQPVTRGQFLIMASNLMEYEPDDAQMSSGFVDVDESPNWMQPYIVSAMRAGFVSGSSSDAGLMFRPTDNLTAPEAAVMLQNMLQLPEVRSAGSFDLPDTIPVWAVDAVSALHGAGVPVEMTSFTRRDAANMLYDVSCLLDLES